MELYVAENLGAGMKMNFRPASLGRSGHRERCNRVTVAKFHRIYLPVAPNRQFQRIRKRIDYRDADPMQSTGNLVAVAVELSAGVQYRHHDFGRRPGGFVFRVNARGNSTPVIHDADRVVGMDDDFYFVAVSRQRLVNRVVKNFEHHVVQSGAVARITDIHAGPFAHCLQSFEYLYAVGVIFR